MATDWTDFSASFNLSINANGAKSDAAGAVNITDAGNFPLPNCQLPALAFGSGAGQGNQYIRRRFSLAGGGAKTIDLTNITDNDSAGIVANFAAVKFIAIQNTSHLLTPATPVITWGPGATNGQSFGWASVAHPTDQVQKTLNPGELDFLTNLNGSGWNTTTNKNVTVTNTDGTNGAQFDIIIGGVSA